MSREQEKYIINLFLPLFENALTDQQLDEIAHHMKRYISQEDLQLLEKSTGNEKFELFFKALNKSSRDGLKYVLINSLKNLELEAIVDCCFDEETNKYILWVLENWANILENKSAIEQTISSVVNGKSGKERLFKFAHYVATAEKDSSLIPTTLGILQKQLVSFPNSNDVPVEYAKDVDTKLLPLVHMLDDTFSHDTIVIVAKTMSSKTHISKGGIKKIKYAKGQKGQQNSPANKLVHSLICNAKENWEDLFLTSVYDTGQAIISEIVKAYMSSPSDKYITWLLSNWSFLKQQHVVVQKTFEELCMTKSTHQDYQQEERFLHIMHDAILCNGSEKLKKFVEGVQEELAEIPLKQDTVTKPQAVKRDYVGQPCNAISGDANDVSKTSKVLAVQLSETVFKISFPDEDSLNKLLNCGSINTSDSRKTISKTKDDMETSSISDNIEIPSKKQHKKCESDHTNVKSTETKAKIQQNYDTSDLSTQDGVFDKKFQQFESKMIDVSLLPQKKLENSNPVKEIPKIETKQPDALQSSSQYDDRSNSTKNVPQPMEVDQQNLDDKKDELPEQKSGKSFAEAVTGKSDNGVSVGNVDAVKSNTRIPAVSEQQPGGIQNNFEFDDYQKLVAQSKHMVEFRAILCYQDLAKGASLCVYIVQKDVIYRMEYDSLSNSYYFMFVSDNYMCNDSWTYKYCISNGDFTYWEFFPTNEGIFNRKCKIQYDQKCDGHAIFMDVVLMQSCSFKKYQELYESKLSLFIPSLKSICLDEKDITHLDVSNSMKILKNFLIGQKNGLTVSQLNFPGYMEIRTNSVQKALPLIWKNLCEDGQLSGQQASDSKVYLKSLLSVLAFGLVAQKDISLVDDSIKVSLCKWLSLHVIDQDCQTFLIAQLHLLNNNWNGTKRVAHSSPFKVKFMEIFKQLVTVPYFILVLPLYKLVQIITADALVEEGTRPTLPLYIGNWTDLRIELRRPEYVKDIKSMAKEIVILFKRFPWICDMYGEVLCLETATDLLKSGSEYDVIFSMETVFTKYLYFWRNISKPFANECVDETVAVVLSTDLVQKLKTTAEEYVGDRTTGEFDVKKSMAWLNHAKDLLDLLKRYLNKIERYDIGCISCLIEVINSILETTEIINENGNNRKLNQLVETVQKGALSTGYSMFHAHVYAELTEQEIKLWNLLTDCKWHDEQFSHLWLEKCCEAVEKVIPIKFKKSTKDLLEFYAEKFEGMKPNQLITEWFTTVLMKSVEESFDSNAVMKAVTKYTGFFQPEILKICQKIFVKQWNSFTLESISGIMINEEIIVLEFLQHWRPIAQFLHILCPSYRDSKEKGKKSLDIIIRLDSAISRILWCLRNGDIPVAHLHKLNDVETTFWECYDALRLRKDSSVDQISQEQFRNLLALRQADLKSYLDIKATLEALLYFALTLNAEKISIDASDLEHKLHENVSLLPIKQLVQSKTYLSRQSLDSSVQHNVIAFDLSEKDMNLVMEMKQTKALDSHFIQKKMKQVAVTTGKKQFTFTEFLQHVCGPAKKHILETVQNIENGNIRLQKIRDLFEDDVEKYENRKQKIRAELEILCHLHEKEIGKPKSYVSKRTEQIENYFKMKENLTIAIALKNTQKTLQLKGDFSALDIPLNIARKSEESCLYQIDKDVITQTQVMQGISAKKISILKEFTHCRNLIVWLRTNMKNIGEVKVMSDLAMISAGETAIEVDRVSCFFSAVMGFAPLIFELPVESGLDDLLKVCREMWPNVERDPAILAHWIETSKHLEWLSGVKDFHGSVEKSSLTRAQQINSHGIYMIGLINQATPCLENCLTLSLQQADKDDLKMKLSELHDLQSRLMLIAGEAEKGKHDVTRFMDILSNVENLAKSYILLKESGCLLFDNWRAVIRCTNDDNTRGVTVEVYFDEKSPAISSGENVIQEVQNLTTVLHETYAQWMHYLNDKRTEHYHLNHYNIHQLTSLCKQLAKTEGDDFSDQIYTLLASVAENVTFANIDDCLEEATRIDINDAEEISIMQDEGTISTIEKKKKVIRKLVASDLSANVAKAAVQVIKSLDIDDCYLWGLENEIYEEKIIYLKKSFDEEVAFEARGAHVNVLQNVINERSQLSLEDVIRRIQSDLDEDANETVGTTIKTICERYFLGTAVTSLDDCVSLEHLGQFLAMLGMSNEKKQSMPMRTFPQQLVQGKPNLVLCPQVDVWRTLLNIYMYSPEQPLPTATEVLICSESTTSEDVELLLRRAIQSPIDKGNRVFCLACADELSFDVAKATEQTFQQLTQMEEKNEHYQLIILTSSLHHFLSSCFDEYQVKNNFPAHSISIEDYLKQHLCMKSFEGDTAARVDRDHALVRVIFSEAAGMGKSLFIKRCREELATYFEDIVYYNSSVIRFLEKNINVDDIVASLTLGNAGDNCNSDPHFIHIDITPSVEQGVYKLLFDLIILGVIQNSQGVLWRRRPEHFYAIEYTNPSAMGVTSFYDMLSMFPYVTCLSPLQVRDHLINLTSSDEAENVLMDLQLLRSEIYQRPYQYLLRYANHLNLDEFAYYKPEENAVECLQTLLKYCTITEPSWLELSHFCRFLNVQLSDCEKSVFCDVNVVGADSGLLGFKQFVVRFMIRMSQDFATPSLNIADDDDIADNHEESDVFELHQLRRHWENGFHPYLFFNDDRESLSFVHFNINNQGHLCHPKTKEIVENNVMTVNLFNGLALNKVNMQQDFDLLSRYDQLTTLCQVFGLRDVFDPDPTYELTTDNVLKMLAIHMRFRCDIPVVVMGETGCGKTRMVEFMSRLKAGKDQNIENMVVVKVHGGITVAKIQDKVREAIKLAKRNLQNGKVETILFLDEANTTEAIYAIKEIVCDGTVHGQTFTDAGLKIVAACNPYRRHSDEVIESMERTGLGFNVTAGDATEKFAGIPMRHLVYRVISLPPSMQPLVWDFGQLNDETENMYIRQMVCKLESDIANDEDLPNFPEEMKDTITSSLARSQRYMRQRRDVCSFVSLRDVERTIQSFTWFYKQLKILNPMIEYQRNEGKMGKSNMSYVMRALIQALGMCYHATLDHRDAYREMIAEELSKTARGQVTENDILNDIIACQSVFINAIDLEKDIAKNEALRENVFMIVLCAEMRIPLFLVGKPGSSKSLAKTIVTDAMQGRNSRHDLFRRLKQIQVLSFQCSAISDAAGIEAVFRQCAQLQKKQDLSKFVAVVVLDEIGLAEDSPKMPLKVLHPLLESASTTHSSLQVEPYSRVGFVGISNWALDPAKMNRGIFVTRGEPSKDDLHMTAEAIFDSKKGEFLKVKGFITAATNAYLEIYKQQDKEFFGLRDYYGLLKMIFAIVSRNHVLEFSDAITAVMRNFSGSVEDVSGIFIDHFMNVFDQVHKIHVPVTKLIFKNLHSDFESRFLLLLTKQYSAVSLLPTVMGDIKDFQVIFGSSFPRDHDYTEVCRNINRIKVCMESGRAVVLLNLRDLYESLYDALNQHYVTFADQRYVDLGLGGHRVKCRVKTGFRLIVIEEKEVVYKEFPIPLLNRLEKHVFEVKNVLEPNRMSLASQLKEWMKVFSKVRILKYPNKYFTEYDAFAGYNDDLAASTLLSLKPAASDLREITERTLLQTASLDAVCRLAKSGLQNKVEMLRKIYMVEQQHDTLWLMLQQKLKQDYPISVFEITSYSQVLNERDRQNLERLLQLSKNRIMLITLQQFKTEQEYSQVLDHFFEFAFSQNDSEVKHDSTYVLLIQCLQAYQFGNLIACAKYSAMNKVKNFNFEKSESHCKVVIAFIFSLERRNKLDSSTLSFTSFHSQDCESVYIDELKPGREHISPVSTMWNSTIAEVFEKGLYVANHNESNTLDLQRLLSESIPEAMAKLRNEANTQGRNRVKILNSLCFHNAVSTAFFPLMLKQILKLLQDRERKLENRENWIIEEACSVETLQEGGSFRNALWLRLRKVVAVALAKIISVVDSDNNLDIIANYDVTTNNFVDSWFKMFASPGMCSFQWSDATDGTDLIVHRRLNFSCSFPFARAVYDFLSQHWEITLQQNVENQQDTFAQRIQKSTLHSLLTGVSEQNGLTAINYFSHDLAHLIYQPLTVQTCHQLEYDFVEHAVVEVFKQQRAHSRSCQTAIVELFLIFMDIKPVLNRFSEIIAVFPSIVAEHQATWITEQSKSRKIIIDQLAFRSLVRKLQGEASREIGSVETCKEWKSLVVKMKHVADKLIADSDEEIQLAWQEILFVEIFLDQLIPPSADSTAVQNYLKTLAPLARRLWTGASKLKDLSSLQFLNIITKTLQGCTREIHLRLLCSWNDIRCRSCKADKLVEPVLLSCRHYICLKCIPTKSSEKTCPTCRKKISHPEELQPVELNEKQAQELNKFKSACTSFFLEYLSTLCFPEPQTDKENYQRQPPDEKITAALEKLVICNGETKTMSPLQSNYDTNPTARSYILRLLLRCDRNLVQRQLNDHFKTMETVLHDKEILMGIYVQCVQDILHNRSICQGEDDIINTKFALNILLECVEISSNLSELNQIQNLDFCAKLLYLARVFVSCIFEIKHQQPSHLKNYKQIQVYMQRACKLCEGPNFTVMKQYIIKYMCRRHGTDAFNLLLENQYFKSLVPQNLVPGRGTNQDLYLQSDMLVLAGQSYVKTKALLLDVVQNDDFPELFQNVIHETQQSPDSSIQVLLALSVWCAHGDTENQLRQDVYRQLAGRIQPQLSIHTFLNDVARKSLKITYLDDASLQMNYKLIEIVIILGVTLFCNNQGLLNVLSTIITNPSRCEALFLPTMPASNYFAVRAVMATRGGAKLHFCPNGHPYYIGECTRPVEASTCSDCGAPIGGLRHRLFDGNQAGELTEASQAGYRLGQPNQQVQTTPERKLSKLSVCATRICLHAAMLLGARNNNAIQRLVNVRGNQNDVSVFLLKHIEKDLRELARCLGRSIDDAFIVMHHILHRMRSTNTGNQNCHWTTMAAREVWEEEFQRHYLSLVFMDIDGVVNQAQHILFNAEKFIEKPLQRLVYELKHGEDIPTGIVNWNCPRLWKYRIHVDIQHLRQRLEAVNAKIGGEGAVLKTILNVEDLDLIKHVHSILSLQKKMITRYRQKIDMAEADKITLQEYLEEENYVPEREVNSYIKLWNNVRQLLMKVDRYSTLHDYFKVAMTLGSPISMCLPSKRGRGCCALVLVEYLTTKQNDILQQCRDIIIPHPTFPLVNVPQLTTNDLICIDENRDLMPLVLANSQYETMTSEAGPKHTISYNFGLLEKKVMEKFLLRKAIINTETIPVLQYPQDMGLKQDFEIVRNKLNQVLLPVKMCQDIDTVAEAAMTANVCQVVRTLTLVIQFLAKLGGEVEQTICDYAERDLSLSKDDTEMIPRSARIRHCLALYERMSWHKSRKLASNGQSPFENVVDVVEDIADHDLVENLRKELSQMNIQRLQLELNSLLMVGPEINAEWGLSMVLRNYLDGKHDVDNSWCERIPEEILFKNTVHLFNMTMDYPIV